MKSDIKTLVTTHPEWVHQNDELVAEWKLQNFNETKALISQLCELADTHNHHPLVAFGYNSIQVKTTTHDEGNMVTEKDVELAVAISEMINKQNATH